jgi:pimeloyl-ACP methyl ester carboxylesterase
MEGRAFEGAPTAKAASSLRFGNVRLAGGPRLHYAEYGEPRGEPILFLHGWPDSWFSFSRVLPLLPPRYRALAVDQRGFGDSERPDSGYRIADLASDAAAFLDALGVQRATVVGHSMGTFVSRRLAEVHPERVARLVLIGTAFSPDNAVTREVRASLIGLEDPVPTEFARQFQASTVYAPVRPDFFEGLIAESVKLPARLWRAVFDGIMAFDDVNRLGEIAVPTLLLWGERDALFPREDQQRLAARIPSARLKTYPDTGHCPNWEIPDTVAADLDAFIRKT